MGGGRGGCDARVACALATWATASSASSSASSTRQVVPLATRTEPTICYGRDHSDNPRLFC